MNKHDFVQLLATDDEILIEDATKMINVVLKRIEKDGIHKREKKSRFLPEEESLLNPERY